jgi:hypothetical protein
MSILSPLRHSAEAALLMRRVDSYKREKQKLLSETARAVALLDEKIAAAELILKDVASDSITEQAQTMVGARDQAQLPEADPSALKPKVRSEANLTAIEAMREIAVRLGRESPEGFSAKQVLEAFQADERIDSRLRDVSEGYAYHVMTRFVTERLITKVERGKYVLIETVAGAAEDPTGVLVASEDGFKMVPMTKEERVREETRRYLSKRANKTAHRASIADYLASHSGPLSNVRSPLKIWAVYVTKWPEFTTDGQGNYTLVDSPKSESAG